MTEHPRRGKSTLLALTLTAALAALSPAVGAAPVFLGPTPYLSFANSPFNSGGFAYFHLEDFEDGALNVTGATASAGWSVLPPGPLTDSVDADDGSIDGSAAAGRSFFSTLLSNSLTITFDAAALGSLPTHAGIVWTDVGPDFGQVSFSAVDANGTPHTGIGPFLLGDGTVASGTAEDRFFGVSDPLGIAQITISTNSTDWEVDHLQFGFKPAAVGEPGTLALLVAGVAGLLRRRSKRTLT